ncbi:MAG: hypothetical protein HYU44_09465, partial [Betaproteobacteria bacterium]|nr:hypothetical protein [Betaproteobacteria bacterium]
MPLVDLLGKQEGIPGVKVAEYRGTFSIDSESAIKEKLEAGTLDQIVAALTKPANLVSHPAAASGAEDPVLTGTFEEINESFRAQNATDELPIIPPTVQKVEEFLWRNGSFPEGREGHP